MAKNSFIVDVTFNGKLHFSCSAFPIKHWASSIENKIPKKRLINYVYIFFENEIFFHASICMSFHFETYLGLIGFKFCS